MTFNPGDVVRLRSKNDSSMDMTVEGMNTTTNQTTVRTVWFDVKQRIQRGAFPTDSVILIRKNFDYPEPKVGECTAL